MDPLGELEDSLAYMFELQKMPGNGKYIHPLVNELKKAIENYKKNTEELADLTKAITKAYPIIENYVDICTVKQKMDALIGQKGGSIKWNSHNRPSNLVVSSTEIVCSDTEADFISWFSILIGQKFINLNAEKQVQLLVNEQSKKELRIKLGVYLRRDPDFLLNLAMDSVKNFIKLMSSRLCYKFEKHQIAKVISHHGKIIISESLNPQEQLEKLICLLDKKLTPNGFSLDKLLKDPLAKAELEKLQDIQLYLSPEPTRLGLA